MQTTKKISSDVYKFLFLTISPIWVFLLVTGFQEQIGGTGTVNLYFYVAYSTVVFVAYSFITQGHVSVGFFRVLADSGTRRVALKKTLIAAAIALVIIAFTPIGFFGGLLLFTFWVHYHYFRQHFGVLRLLSPIGRLSSVWERRFDNFFCATVYLVPILAFFPDYYFEPVRISKLLVSIGFIGSVSAVMGILEFLVGFSAKIFPALLVVWTGFVVWIAWVAWKTRSQWDHVVFALAFLLSNVLAAQFLPPLMVIVNSVFLHSVQYYFIVGNDYSRAQAKWTKALRILSVLFVGLAFGVIFTFYPPATFISSGETKFMILAGLGIAANIVHFYMDSYIWKRSK